MASQSPPSSPTANSHTLDLMRMMELVLTVMQQQNAALVQQTLYNIKKPVGYQRSPDEADQWFRDMERIYSAKRCPNENRLAYSEYMLTGEASHWWSSMRMLLESSKTPISWEIFKLKFYVEYFPDSVRFAKEVEFLELVQGGMTCRKFENGLLGDLKLMVAGLCIKQFLSLVERAKVLEKTDKEVERQQPNVGGPVSSKSSLGSKRTPYAQPSSSRVRSQSSRPPVPFGQQTVLAHIRCFSCGGPYY
ncbi:uncharacterized protein LOC124823981 [Vigna umbellata]|uniref:uncharacterized protein LOC124823981 n=1 Tax=Vigna umbellata TaxID=87088 RepID=UPI001F5FDD59|nr:uncharacterized protein LOC124823981 [Vigna umbellata]